MSISTYPKGTVVLTVSTASGLFLVTSQDRVSWRIEETALQNTSVYYAVFDPRNNYRLFASDKDASGPALRYSDDFGQSWQQPKRGIHFAPESGLKLANIWMIEPGRVNEPDTLYAGTDHASLWTSHDAGETWEINHGLLSHPTFPNWMPGAGGMCLHSIVPDHSNTSRMWVAISSVGCLRTDDGGETWAFVNKNLCADYLPAPLPEYGFCVHRLIQHPTQADVLYQQNHQGEYKSLNGGDDWIDMRNNLPSEFGFPIAMDINHPDTLYTAVMHGEGRYNINNQFTIYRSDNAGDHWVELTEGLPGGEGVRIGVLRHGLATDSYDPCGVYAGTNTGQLFASNNRGDSWQQIATFLPRIHSVTATVLA